MHSKRAQIIIAIIVVVIGVPFPQKSETQPIKSKDRTNKSGLHTPKTKYSSTKPETQPPNSEYHYHYDGDNVSVPKIIPRCLKIRALGSSKTIYLSGCRYWYQNPL